MLVGTKAKANENVLLTLSTCTTAISILNELLHPHNEERITLNERGTMLPSLFIFNFIWLFVLSLIMSKVVKVVLVGDSVMY